jgi:hypothetical protein
MNVAQELWWRQAQSDFDIFARLRRAGVHECHLLHYLQMATEKLSKAYLWRSGKPPPKSHIGFLRFLKAILDRRPAEFERIAKLLGFARTADMERWVANIQTLAYDLQNIAPAESQNGVNPEYPWPHEEPINYPAGHRFTLWQQIANSGQGRKLLVFVSQAIARFESYS